MAQGGGGGGGGGGGQKKQFFREFYSENPKTNFLFQNFCLSYHEEVYYLKTINPEKDVHGVQKMPLRKGGVLNLKESLTRVATIILEKK